MTIKRVGFCLENCGQGLVGSEVNRRGNAVLRSLSNTNDRGPEEEGVRIDLGMANPGTVS